MEPEFSADDIKPLQDSDDVVEEPMSEEEEEQEEESGASDESHHEETNTHVATCRQTVQRSASEDIHTTSYHPGDTVGTNAHSTPARAQKRKQPEKNSKAKRAKLKQCGKQDAQTDEAANSDTESEGSVQINTSDEDKTSADEEVTEPAISQKKQSKLEARSSEETFAKFSPLVTKYASSSGLFTVMSTEMEPSVTTVKQGEIFCEASFCLCTCSRITPPPNGHTVPSLV